MTGRGNYILLGKVYARLVRMISIALSMPSATAAPTASEAFVGAEEDELATEPGTAPQVVNVTPSLALEGSLQPSAPMGTGGLDLPEQSAD